MTDNNKYQRWYNELIERARNRVIDGYVEKHHIVPRSLGGTDEPENLVDLTAREHLIAHMLLPRFVETPGPMWSALWGMMNTRGLRIGSRVYEEARIRHAQVHSAALKGKKGRPKSEEIKAKISATLKGRSRSEETKAKISAALKGRKQSAQVVEAKRQKTKEYWAKKKLA